MPLLRTAGLTALATACALVLTACGDDGPDVDAGDQIMAAYTNQFTAGSAAEVLLPTGLLEVWAAQPVDALEGGETRELRPYPAESGTSYVPISWRYDPEHFAEIADFLDADGAPTVELTTGDNTYRLPPPARHTPEQSFYVVVEGDAAGVTLSLTYDGVTQTLDVYSGDLDTGRAETLYDVSDFDLEPRPCDGSSWFGKEAAAVRFDCTVTGPLLLPFAAGHWAPEGKEMAAIAFSTVLNLYATNDADGSGRWAGTAVETTLRLGKQEPMSIIRTGDADDTCPNLAQGTCQYSARAVFEVGEKVPKRLRVEQAYELLALQGAGDTSQGDVTEATAKGAVTLR